MTLGVHIHIRAVLSISWHVFFPLAYIYVYIYKNMLSVESSWVWHCLASKADWLTLFF